LDGFDEDQMMTFFRDKNVVLTSEQSETIHANEIVILKRTTQDGSKASALARCVCKGDDRLLIPVEKIDSAFGLKPLNKEQTFSLDLLFDPSIRLVTLVGPSGTGKTLLAVAAGLDQLKSLGQRGVYRKLLVTRPVHPLGRDIGFLPGTLDEKMEPWLAPIRDNLNFLMSGKKERNGARKQRNGTRYKEDPYISLLQDDGILEIEAITYIRGRSIPNCFMVIDEAQNLSMHELKTIITRVGENTKIVLTGDIEQIDNAHVDVYTNGLTYAVEKFKDSPIAGHVTLTKGERSELATIASRIL
jgi:PhoH-like ATPase